MSIIARLFRTLFTAEPGVWWAALPPAGVPSGAGCPGDGRRDAPGWAGRSSAGGSVSSAARGDQRRVVVLGIVAATLFLDDYHVRLGGLRSLAGLFPLLFPGLSRFAGFVGHLFRLLQPFLRRLHLLLAGTRLNGYHLGLHRLGHGLVGVGDIALLIHGFDGVWLPASGLIASTASNNTILRFSFISSTLRNLRTL